MFSDIMYILNSFCKSSTYMHFIVEKVMYSSIETYVCSYVIRFANLAHTFSCSKRQSAQALTTYVGMYVPT
jgi:hypothetical protein